MIGDLDTDGGEALASGLPKGYALGFNRRADADVVYAVTCGFLIATLSTGMTKQNCSPKQSVDLPLVESMWWLQMPELPLRMVCL